MNRTTARRRTDAAVGWTAQDLLPPQGQATNEAPDEPPAPEGVQPEGAVRKKARRRASTGGLLRFRALTEARVPAARQRHVAGADATGPAARTGRAAPRRHLVPDPASLLA